MRAIAVLVASGCAYKAGSFSHPQQGFLGQKVTVGCLDVSVERRGDMPDGARVLEYYFGNRCDQPQMIDLRHARVMGRTWEGDEIALEPYDPRDEIRPLQLDGRRVGTEVLAYNSQASLAQVCVDVASIVAANDVRWICFASDARADVVSEVTP